MSADGLGPWVAGHGWQRLSTGGRVLVGEWSDSVVCVVLANAARISIDTEPDGGGYWLRLHPPALASEAVGAFPYLDLAVVVVEGGELQITDVPSTGLQRMNLDISMPQAAEVSFTCVVPPARVEPLMELLARLPVRRSPQWQVPASGATVWRGRLEGDRAVLEHLPADDSEWEEEAMPVVGLGELDWDAPGT